VSRSTAERTIREARESGYVVDQPSGKEVLYFLSDAMFNHCVNFFRTFMDADRLMKTLGYDKD
jgi:hypothetical protein